MSANGANITDATAERKHPIGSGADRRKRCRVKMEARVHVRGAIGTIDAFEDMGKSIDVTRDGLLISMSRGRLLGRPASASHLPLLDRAYRHQPGAKGKGRSQHIDARLPVLRGRAIPRRLSPEDPSWAQNPPIEPGEDSRSGT